MKAKILLLFVFIFSVAVYSMHKNGYVSRIHVRASGNQNDSLAKKNSKIEAAKKPFESAVPKHDSVPQKTEVIKQDLLQKNIDEYSKLREEQFKNNERIKNLETQLNDLKTKNSGIDKSKSGVIEKIRVDLAGLTGAKKIHFGTDDYFVVVVNTDSSDIRLHWRDKTKMNYSTLGALISALKLDKKEIQVATNGGMYLADGSPQGLFVENYETLKPIDLTDPNDDNFYLKPNGVFYIDSNGRGHIDTSESYARQKLLRVKYATQSGPMLVMNGRIHDKFTDGSTNDKIRSGVGIMNEKKVVFAISVNEVSFYDFALLFRDIMGCSNALFLDGAISKMYIPKISEDTGGHYGPIISVVKK